jgi:hypothetical protein
LSPLATLSRPAESLFFNRGDAAQSIETAQSARKKNELFSARNDSAFSNLPKGWLRGIIFRPR